MFDLNRVFLIGNLTRNPELRTTPNGMSVCSFGLATNRSYTDSTGAKKDQVEFHNMVAWSKLAEICSQYLVKGKKIFAEGRLQTREWEAQDGTKKQRTEIVLENMIMLGGPGRGDSNGAAVRNGAETNATNTVKTGAEAGVQEEEIQIEDIPF